MIRFLSRLLSFVFFALSVLFMVIDATRSIAASALELTSLQSTWMAAFPEGPEAAGNWLSDNFHPFLNETLLASLSVCPTFLFCAIVAILFWFFGQNPHRPRGQLR